MRLAVISHTVCWPSKGSPSGYATDGGFPFQMQAISELFDETHLVVPVTASSNPTGEVSLVGQRLSVTPLAIPNGKNYMRKLGLPWWLIKNLPVIVRQIRDADAVHTPIPSDVGTIGL